MTLLKQALRSVWRGRRAYLACIVLMALGICVYIAFNLLFANLSAAMDALYENQRFGDAFAVVTSVSESAVERLRGVTGVARVSATNVTDARVTGLDDDRIITLRFSSFDPNDAERLNDFLLTQGALPGEDGFLLGEGFAEANGLLPGDVITTVIDGRETRLTVSGLVQSPEYVYAIPGTGQLMPDDSAFGFAFMEAGRLGTLTGREGLYTNLSFELEENALWGPVEAELEELLAPYGLEAIYERKDQPSHSMLSQEVESLGAMATSLPMTFIFISVAILYIMLKRIIEQERMQIGTLKAFGFSNGSILGHYLIYGGITGVCGGALGLLTGVWMTGGMTVLYLEYFSLPNIQVPPDPAVLVTGFAIGAASGLAGAFMGTRGILKLEPAEAMRPVAPPAVRGDVIGRLPILRALLASHGYMACRNITRNRFRSFFVVVGLAFSFAITALMGSFTELFDSMMLDQFKKVELFSVKVSFKLPAPGGGAAESARALPGVHRAELMLELPADLTRENLSENIAITGLEAESRLYHLYDSEAKAQIPLPPGGLVLTKNLAEKLRARRGDILTVKTAYTGDDEFKLPVLEVFNSNLGQSAFMRLDSLWELLDSPAVATALLLDASDPAVIREKLLDAENVSAITDQSQTRKIYEDMIDTYAFMLTMMQAAGAGIAFAIITNTASISLSERKREYATMRVLGMHPREIGRVVSFEYWTLALPALPLGMGLTRLLKQGLSEIIATEMFSFPVTTQPASYITSAAFCALAVLLSNLLAGRKIARFDMVEVLKERE